jgi:glucose-fructose oxidoreductase
MSARTWRVAGVSFDHMHIGDLLRMVAGHPQARLVGISDAQPERMQQAIQSLGIPDSAVFTDYRECLERTRPDLVLLCPSTLQHAEWVERVAPYGAHILVEKPFAASVADADRMIRAMAPGRQLAINWPLRWVPSHASTQRLIEEGRIGEVQEVHYYDGNRGPLYHLADKVEVLNPGDKNRSWWYQASRGGGSLLDYLGYGVTLGAWFDGGRLPVEVTCVTGGDPALEVDEHSLTICRYASGHLSKFETRWGTFTDPWIHQPTPRCGFSIVGSRGTIASDDYACSLRVQTREEPQGYLHPVAPLEAPFQNPIQYILHCLDFDRPVEGPLSPAVARLGQLITDAALRSARLRRAVPLETVV